MNIKRRYTGTQPYYIPSAKRILYHNDTVELDEEAWYGIGRTQAGAFILEHSFIDVEEEGSFDLEMEDAPDMPPEAAPVEDVVKIQQIDLS